MCCQGWQIRQHIPSVLFLCSILLSLAFVFRGEIARCSLGTPWAEASLPRCRFGQFAAARGKRASTTECRMIVISYLSEAVLHLLRWFSFQSPSLSCSPWDVFLLRTGTQSVKLTAHGERLESGEIIGGERDEGSNKQCMRIWKWKWGREINCYRGLGIAGLFHFAHILVFKVSFSLPVWLSPPTVCDF